MPIPGLIIAAPRSSSGKTTVTLGLQRALTRRGYRVAPFKAGPDYIDPAFHAAATGRASYNLDSFAMSPALIAALVESGAQGADLILAEGAMGLFDGVRTAPGRSGSSADLAVLTGWPVVIVLDVSGQAQSAGASVLGLKTFDPRIAIAGVILNKVASDRHRRLAEEGIARAGVPVLGALMRQEGLALPERHLGLVQAGETTALEARLEALADAVEASVDLAMLVALATASPLSSPPDNALPPAPGSHIALAQDAAFSFLYPHLALAWSQGGARITPFSPLADEAPDDACDICWLPGGYPELHAARLATATHFKEGMRRFAATRPVHGECGGYMVLGETIEDAEGIRHSMLGLLPLATSFKQRALHLGYRKARLLSDTPLGKAGGLLIGHEFHYASIVATGNEANFVALCDGEDRPLGFAGHRQGRVSGSFFHMVAIG